jgi:VanZ family protein
MSASPALFNPAQSSRSRNANHWLPVFYALVFICFTSTTFMGGSHTQILVNAVWKAVLGTWHWDLTGEVNGVGRKVGHFIGYGLVGLIFRNAWYKSARAFHWVPRNLLMLFAASTAVSSTFAVACIDEWHQTFLVGRVGSLHDALIDAAGAVFLNAIVWTIVARKRRRLIERSQGITIHCALERSRMNSI